MSAQEAIARIDTYLRLVAERKLEEAKQFLADGATFTFPPSATFASLDEVVAGARGRYQWCDKVRDRWDVAEQSDGTVVVYSLGTLFGVNLHGVRFEGIRYVDRFELRDGLITRQEVWNDLAESGVLQLREPALAARQ